MSPVIKCFYFLVFLFANILLNCGSIIPQYIRIVGGKAGKIERFPFLVSLQADEYPFHICGGSIINEKWILTAAHCTQRNFSYYVRTGSSYTYEGGQIYEVSKVYSHSKFTNLTFNSDIALLKLEKPIKFNSRTKAIKLPGVRQKYIPTNSPVIVTGWGNTMDWNITDDSLRYVKVYTTDKNTCVRDFKSIDIDLTNTMFCASYPGGGKDACSGDSGGPLIYYNRLIGIVSFGNGCADERYPGVYTNVTVLHDWIHKVTGIRKL